MKKLLLGALLATSFTFGTEESTSIGKAIINGNISQVQEYLEETKLSSDEFDALIIIAHQMVKKYENSAKLNHKKQFRSWEAFGTNLGKQTCNIFSMLTFVALFGTATEIARKTQLLENVSNSWLIPLKDVSQISASVDQDLRFLGRSALIATLFTLGAVSCKVANYYFAKKQEEDIATAHQNAIEIEALLRSFAAKQKASNQSF